MKKIKNNMIILFLLVIVLIVFLFYINKNNEGFDANTKITSGEYMITWNGKVLCDININKNGTVCFLDPFNDIITNSSNGLGINSYKWTVIPRSTSSTEKYFYIKNGRSGSFLAYKKKEYQNEYDKLWVYKPSSNTNNNKEPHDKFTAIPLIDGTERFNLVTDTRPEGTLFTINVSSTNNEKYEVTRSTENSISNETKKIYVRFIPL
jgi:hypothetical protein